MIPHCLCGRGGAQEVIREYDRVSVLDQGCLGYKKKSYMIIGNMVHNMVIYKVIWESFVVVLNP